MTLGEQPQPQKKISYQPEELRAFLSKVEPASNILSLTAEVVAEVKTLESELFCLGSFLISYKLSPYGPALLDCEANFVHKDQPAKRAPHLEVIIEEMIHEVFQRESDDVATNLSEDLILQVSYGAQGSALRLKDDPLALSQKFRDFAGPLIDLSQMPVISSSPACFMHSSEIADLVEGLHESEHNPHLLLSASTDVQYFTCPESLLEFLKSSTKPEQVVQVINVSALANLPMFSESAEPNEQTDQEDGLAEESEMTPEEQNSLELLATIVDRIEQDNGENIDELFEDYEDEMARLRIQHAESQHQHLRALSVGRLPNEFMEELTLDLRFKIVRILTPDTDTVAVLDYSSPAD